MSKKNRYNITLSKDLEYYVDKLIKSCGLSRFVEDSIRRHTGIIESEELKDQLINLENQKIEIEKMFIEIKDKLEINESKVSDEQRINGYIDELRKVQRTYDIEKMNSKRGFSRSVRGIELTKEIKHLRKLLNSHGVDLAIVMSGKENP